MGRMLTVFMLSFGFFANGLYADEIKTREVFVHISEVFVPTETNSNGDSYVVVSGMYPNTCYRWNRGEVTHNTEKSHSVRLVATFSETTCLMVMVPYSRDVVLGKLSPGQHTVRFVNPDETYFERTINVR